MSNCAKATAGAMESEVATTNNVSLSTTDCPVCLVTFRTPKSLKCGHSVCAECVQKLSNDGGRPGPISFLCPVCRQIIITPAGGLPTNYVLQDVIEAQKQKDAREEEKRKAKRESEAQKALMDEQQRKARFPYKCDGCPKRISLAKARLCTDCKKILCADCIISKHREHAYNDLKDSLEKSRQELTEWRSKTEAINESVREAETEMSTRMEDANRCYQTATSVMEPLMPLVRDVFQSLKAEHAVLRCTSDKDLERMTVNGELREYLKTCDEKLANLGPKFDNFKEKTSMIIDLLTMAADSLIQISVDLSTEFGVAGTEINQIEEPMQEMSADQIPEMTEIGRSTSEDNRVDGTGAAAAADGLGLGSGMENQNMNRVGAGYATLDVVVVSEEPSPRVDNSFDSQDWNDPRLNRNRGGANGGRRVRTCFCCGEEGHFARDCPRKFAARNVNNDDGDGFGRGGLGRGIGFGVGGFWDDVSDIEFGQLRPAQGLGGIGRGVRIGDSRGRGHQRGRGVGDQDPGESPSPAGGGPGPDRSLWW